jgi:methionine salvage enolase-phosphatase E1
MNPLFQKYVEQINYMLNEAARKKKFDSVKDRMIWERGYLTGLLASLAYKDSDVHLAIRRKINKL